MRQGAGRRTGPRLPAPCRGPLGPCCNTGGGLIASLMPGAADSGDVHRRAGDRRRGGGTKCEGDGGQEGGYTGGGTTRHGGTPVSRWVMTHGQTDRDRGVRILHLSVPLVTIRVRRVTARWLPSGL